MELRSLHKQTLELDPTPTQCATTNVRLNGSNGGDFTVPSSPSLYACVPVRSFARLALQSAQASRGNTNQSNAAGLTILNNNANANTSVSFAVSNIGNGGGQLFSPGGVKSRLQSAHPHSFATQSSTPYGFTASSGGAGGMGDAYLPCTVSVGSTGYTRNTARLRSAYPVASNSNNSNIYLPTAAILSASTINNNSANNNPAQSRRLVSATQRSVQQAVNEPVNIYTTTSTTSYQFAQRTPRQGAPANLYAAPTQPVYSVTASQTTYVPSAVHGHTRPISAAPMRIIPNISHFLFVGHHATRIRYCNL